MVGIEATCLSVEIEVFDRAQYNIFLPTLVLNTAGSKTTWQRGTKILSLLFIHLYYTYLLNASHVLGGRDTAEHGKKILASWSFLLKARQAHLP